jgi:hypothetical protein
LNAKFQKPRGDGQPSLKVVPAPGHVKASSQTGVLDPKTGKIQWRDMTPREGLSARGRLSDAYEEDFTPKGLRKAVTRIGAGARERK